MRAKPHLKFRVFPVTVSGSHFKIHEQVTDTHWITWPSLYSDRMRAVQDIETQLGLKFNNYQSKHIAYGGRK